MVLTKILIDLKSELNLLKMEKRILYKYFYKLKAYYKIYKAKKELIKNIKINVLDVNDIIEMAQMIETANKLNWLEPGVDTVNIEAHTVVYSYTNSKLGGIIIIDLKRIVATPIKLILKSNDSLIDLELIEQLHWTSITGEMMSEDISSHINIDKLYSADYNYAYSDLDIINYYNILIESMIIIIETIFDNIKEGI